MDKKKMLYTGLIAIVLIVIACMAVQFFPGILTYVPGCEQFYPLEPDAKYVAGQAIENDKAYGLFIISQNDFFVKEKLGLIQNYLVNKSYAIGDVRTIRYLERNPEIPYGLFVPHYYNVLPAVEYIIGDQLNEGINMYAFVDPDRKRVTCISYTVRPGVASGNFTYLTGDSSVSIRETNRTGDKPVETLMNVTIVDTGYNPSANLTEAQEREFIDIALNDSRVKHYLDGFDYQAEINGGSYEWEYGTPHNYIIFYPSVDFLIKDAYDNWSPFIRVNIDPRYKTGKEFQPPSGVVKFN